MQKFRYPPVFLDLSQVMHTLLQAADWAEAPIAPGVDQLLKEQRELGNLDVATKKLRDVYNVLVARYNDVEAHVRMGEKPYMAKQGELQREADALPLPPELRASVAHPDITHDGE